MKTPEPASEREYRAYIKKLRQEVRSELKKPPRERDEALIGECGETAAYCERRLSELGAGRDKRFYLNKRPLRWAAAALAAVLLLFGTGVVSYSFGRKALSEQVQWNVMHFRIKENGFRDPEGEIQRNELETRKYDSEEALRAAYGEDLLLPGSLRGVYFVSAEVHGEPGNALIRVEYRVNKKPLILEIDRFDGELFGEKPVEIRPEPHSDESVRVMTEICLYYSDDFKLEHYNSMTVGKGRDSCFVLFSSRSDHYILTGGQGTEILVDIAENMIAMGKEN